MMRDKELRTGKQKSFSVLLAVSLQLCRQDMAERQTQFCERAFSAFLTCTRVGAIASVRSTILKVPLTMSRNASCLCGGHGCSLGGDRDFQARDGVDLSAVRQREDVVLGVEIGAVGQL